jgi:acetyl esterase/lipase
MHHRRTLILVLLSLGSCARLSAEPTTRIDTAAAKAPASTPEVPAGWRRVTSEQGDFTVLFPGTPTTVVIQAASGCGPTPAPAHVLERSNGAALSVTVIDSPRAISSASAARFLDDFAQVSAKQFGGVVQSNQSLQRGGVTGRDVRIALPSEPGSVTRLRVVIAQDRYYQMMASPGTTPDPRDEEDASRFFDSFALAPATGPALDLLSARRGFTTRILPSSYTADGPCSPPPPGVFDLVRYPSPIGALAALLTPDPKDGKRHPAMLWAHGGFGGIGDFLWKSAPVRNDQSARAFREAGMVQMSPSWRGENDNPGRFELFYGEVDDLLAARDYLASLPYVDPERIYLGGHSSGGTLILLAAASTSKFRAAFSFGGTPDIGRVVSDGRGYGNTPFNCASRQEGRLRSPIYFAGAIKRPTFYLEGERSAPLDEVREMKRRADEAGAPLEISIVKGGTHFDILDPLTRLVAGKILEDTGPSCSIQITEREVEAAYAARRR